MGLFDYLASTPGQELMHAVIILLLSIATYLTWRTHQRTKR